MNSGKYHPQNQKKLDVICFLLYFFVVDPAREIVITTPNGQLDGL